MSIFSIKIIACISMFLEHVKYAIPETNNFFTVYLGRIAFPLFAFLITEGYTHTKNLKKYYLRLVLFAIISQIPYMLFRTLVGEYLMLNIMFTLFFGLVTINIYDKIKNKFLSIPLCLIIIAMGSILNTDYGWYGVATILLLYICRKNKNIQIISFSILVGIYYVIEGFFYYISYKVILLYLCTILPTIFIYFYNGEQGKKIKYFFYWFYPVHMIVLYFINLLIR